MHNKISKLALWMYETYLFRTLLFLWLCKKNMQMLQVFYSNHKGSISYKEIDFQGPAVMYISTPNKRWFTIMTVTRKPHIEYEYTSEWIKYTEPTGDKTRWKVEGKPLLFYHNIFDLLSNPVFLALGTHRIVCISCMHTINRMKRCCVTRGFDVNRYIPFPHTPVVAIGHDNRTKKNVWRAAPFFLSVSWAVPFTVIHCGSVVKLDSAIMLCPTEKRKRYLSDIVHTFVYLSGVANGSIDESLSSPNLNIMSG
jgi:hypothetical protein